MPIIGFTPADALQSVMLEAGNYAAKLTLIEGPKASQSQKSVSFFATYQLTKGPFAGKELQIVYNTGCNSTSLLGDRQFSPHTDLLKVEAAINKTKIEPVAKPNFDTDTLLDKELTLVIAVTTKQDGGLGTLITGYLPAGVGDGKAPF